jgi:hypothetical protein
MPVVFPAWARLALGIVIGITTYVVAGEIIRIGDEERGLISSLLTLLAAAGFVPPSPGSIRLSPSANLLLAIGAVVLSYLLNTVIEPDAAWVRGVLVAVLAFGASIGIVPPQAKLR